MIHNLFGDSVQLELAHKTENRGLLPDSHKLTIYIRFLKANLQDKGSAVVEFEAWENEVRFVIGEASKGGMASCWSGKMEGVAPFRGLIAFT
jgi:hypothetical protein